MPSYFLPISICPPPPCPRSPLLSTRPMWSTAPLWRLISAIRRSLLKPGGMFQTTAGAMHSGVSFCWTPDLEKHGTLAQVLPLQCSYLAGVFILESYMYKHTHCISSSPCSLILSFWSTFSMVFIWLLRGLVPFRLCFEAVWERTHSLLVPGTADCVAVARIPPWNREAKQGQVQSQEYRWPLQRKSFYLTKEMTFSKC